MAKKTKEESAKEAEEFSKQLIQALNKEHAGRGEKIAYNLNDDDTPTTIKRWIPTGITQLDYIISNKRNGGLPEGRIIEIHGPPSIGKSHIAAQIAISTQKLGGVCAYIDSENATSVENLIKLGVDTSKNFIYLNATCTEKIFSIMESIIIKTRSLKKNVPVVIIWDSVAASSPKQELDGDYEANSVGLQARAISKGLRKITNIVGHNNVTMVFLNQLRTNIGQLYGDNQVPPGGKAIPFHSSVRIKLSSKGGYIFDPKDKDKSAPIGIGVKAKIIKNKISSPFRDCEFQIHFGVGIKEHEELFDHLRKFCGDEDNDDVIFENMVLQIEGSGGWKTFLATDVKTGEVKIEKKFHKADFGDLLEDKKYKKYLDALIEASFVKGKKEFSIDPESLVEIQAVASMLEEENSVMPE